MGKVRGKRQGQGLLNLASVTHQQCDKSEAEGHNPTVAWHHPGGVLGTPHHQVHHLLVNHPVPDILPSCRPGGLSLQGEQIHSGRSEEDRKQRRSAALNLANFPLPALLPLEAQNRFATGTQGTSSQETTDSQTSD